MEIIALVARVIPLKVTIGGKLTQGKSFLNKRRNLNQQICECMILRTTWLLFPMCI